MTDEVPEALDADALGKRVGVSSRTIRAWVAAGCLPKPPHHGPHTRFPRTSIVIAHAISALRKDQVSLHQIRKYLRGKTDAELRVLGGLPPAPPAPKAPAAALPPSPPPPALPPNASPPPEAPLAAPEVVSKEDRLTVQDALARSAPRDQESGVPIGSEWRRIELLPGLELHVRADASPFAHGLAAAIASGRFTKP